MSLLLEIKSMLALIIKQRLVEQNFQPAATNARSKHIITILVDELHYESVF